MLYVIRMVGSATWNYHYEEKSLEEPKADRDVKLKNAGANLTPQYFQREYGLQDGDIAEVQQLPANTQFSALPKRAFSFKADMQGLDANQQEVDEKISEIDREVVIRIDESGWVCG